MVFPKQYNRDYKHLNLIGHEGTKDTEKHNMHKNLCSSL